MRSIAAASTLAVLAACSPQAGDDVTRGAAASTITPVVIAKFPHLDTDTSIGCILDNARVPEINALATDRLTGATASTRTIVDTIATRDSAAACLAGRPGA